MFKLVILGDAANPHIQRGHGHVGVYFEAAAVIDRAHRRGRDPELEGPAERLALQGHLVQVRQEAPVGLDVGVAHVVAGQHALAGQLAATGHRFPSLFQVHAGARGPVPRRAGIRDAVHIGSRAGRQPGPGERARARAPPARA